MLTESVYGQMPENVSVFGIPTLNKSKNFFKNVSKIRRTISKENSICGAANQAFCKLSHSEVEYAFTLFFT